MAVARVRSRGQITLPREVREAAHLEEGDPIEFTITPDGILLQPKKVIDATQAWFWTLGALAARRDGTSRGGGTGIRRPCDPDDVIRALDLLHRRGGIDLSHARVLRRWGERGRAPEGGRPAEQADALLWSEALERLEGLLRAKGIVVTEI